MAVSTDAYFSNAIQGVPQIAGDANIYQMDKMPRFAIGTKLKRQDGNVYRYSHFGADVGPGKLVSQDVSESSAAAVDMVLASAADTTTDGTIGSKFIEIIGTATTDQYAGGYLCMEDEAGEGYTYRIKGNTVTGNPVASNYRIELYDKIQVAIVALSTGNIVGNLYSNLETANTVDTFSSGVSVSNMDVSEAAFGWIQTEGIATLLTDGTVVLGSGNIIAAVTGATAPAVHTDIIERVATTLIVGGDGEYSTVRLTLS